jgi:hypothetical protein
MNEFVKIAGPISLPVAIGAFVIAGIIYFIAKNVGDQREVLRTLRTALERDPSPQQIGQALQMWPDAKQFPGQHQLNELRRMARDAENAKAKSFEVGKAFSRIVIGIGVLAIIIYAGSLAWNKFGPEPAKEAPAATSQA